MGNCKSKKENSIDGSCENVSPNDESSPQIKANQEHTIVPQSSYSLSSAPTEQVNSREMREKSSNQNVIESTRAEVNCLLLRIHEFHGVKENDKTYQYLDEMLTRCILELDNLDCSNSSDRSNRKQLIKEVNQAIDILDRKLEFNSDLKNLEINLSGPQKNASG